MEATLARASMARILAGVLLIGLAAIHLAVYLSFALTPAYPGILFLLNIAAAIVLAGAIFRGYRLAWHGAALLAALTLISFVAVRTVGLPNFYLTDWVVMVGVLPLGPLSLAVDLLILATYTYVARGRFHAA